MATTTQDLVTLSRARRIAASGEGARIRDASGLSQAELASSVGVDAATISRWERGQRSPRGQAAIRWAALLESLQRCVGSRDP